MTVPAIDTERLTLRRPVAADAAAIHRLAADRRIAEMTAAVPHPYDRSMAEAWIRSVPAGLEAGRIALATVERASGELVGVISISVERERPIGTIGYWIGVPFWGRGYATEAARAVVEYGFRELGLAEIHGACLANNPASGRVLEKLGMHHRGSSVDVVRGDLVAVERYAIVRPEANRGGRLER